MTHSRLQVPYETRSRREHDLPPSCRMRSRRERPHPSCAGAMKNLTITGIVMMAVLTGTAGRSQAQQGAPPERATGIQEKALFLHLLAPRAYTDPPVSAHRILTARVYPFQDFSISVGDSENPFAKPWDGAITSPLWCTNGAPKPRPLDPLWTSGDATLAGRIEEVDGKFLAHLQGRNRTTLNYFHGQIELEKPVYEQGAYFHGGSVWGVWFALSTNADCSGFLKAIENVTLRRPDVVDRNSPLADRWLGDKPSGAPNAGPGKSVGNSETTDGHRR